MSSNIDARRKRLRYRCWHRGTKELDLLLGGFADQEVATMGVAELERLETLLEVPEPELHAWLTGQAAPPPKYDHAVTRRLLAFKYMPGKS